MSWAQRLCSTGGVGVPWLHSGQDALVPCPARAAAHQGLLRKSGLCTQQSQISPGMLLCGVWIVLGVALGHSTEIAAAAPVLPSLQCGGSEFLVLVMALSRVLVQSVGD